MATAEEPLSLELEEFLTKYYQKEVLELANSYPQKKSLKIEFQDLNNYNPELAEKLIQEPKKIIKSTENALKNIDLPVNKKLKEANIRFVELPKSENVLARNIRSHHIGKFISMEGIIRKATEVRPKLTKAHFECVRCGNEQKIEQNGSDFKEPYSCSGCDRKGPFDLDEDKSEFIDSQKLQIQEVPEELRGGEQPQDINVRVIDDITGKGVPGNRVIVNGILKSYQKTNTKGKTNLFGVYIDCNSIEIKEQEFREIEISEEEKEKIIELSDNQNIYQKIIKSIAPTIYGYEKVKEAMALQLFSGVPKKLPDGSRIRGDIHTLLVGDPGIGKCVAPDTNIKIKDRDEIKIKKFVEKHLNNPKEIEDGFFENISNPNIKVPSLDPYTGKKGYKKITKVWKREAPDKMFLIKTKSGKEVEVTPSHPLFIAKENEIITRNSRNLEEGDFIAASRSKSSIKNLEDSSRNSKVTLNNKFPSKSLIWEEIDQIKEKEISYEWVYDLEIKGNHNYLTNNIYSHNSQILRYVANLAPRGVYASGKSSTSAGLCVSPDTVVPTSKGPLKIKELVENNIQNPVEVEPGFYKSNIESNLSLISLNNNGSLKKTFLDSLWKIEAPNEVINVKTESNKEIEITPTTALPIKEESGEIRWIKSKNLEIGEKVAVLGENEILEEIQSLIGSNVGWSEIKNLKYKEPSYNFVYDVTVKDHNFLANSFLVHNTAAAVRDEFGDGKWTLEAGALVLADKGIATIDEIDKMDSKDRSALHEAMEQQSISIAKAGITATLQSRCALLGAANPTYGRFDKYEPIAEQIDLEPTLLSRFDLIFTLKDEPDKSKDSEIASHIITSHEAGEISNKKEKMNDEESVDEIEPEIEPDMLKKYIAFSKRVTPVLTPEAKEKLKEFYIDLRVAGEGEESPVPVTARQLEALIRLAEASARTRLSEKVVDVDAKRAINIVKQCLEEVGVDPETGELDIDMLATGTSKSQRDKIRAIKEIINRLDEDNGAPKEKVIEESTERGISESDARDIIKRLRERGDIIEPKTGKTLRIA